ncbi:MAG TPA: hypothetical protein VEB43_09075 [Anaeromyxobacter sp.]|nr:hypothetical protein [Anaeromyxobacter sp.]
MRNIVLAIAGTAAVFSLAACDPTEKNDYGCTVQFEGQNACTQLHITEVEGNVAEVYCEDELEGTWAYRACTSEERTPGYCQVDDAGDYLPSGTPAKVFFYGIDETVAETACNDGGGAWHGGN